MNGQTTVLVTGASGFIGRRLVAALRASAFDTRVSMARLDHEDVEAEPADIVMHLAGLADVPDSWENPVSYYQTNVLGTLRVLDRCARAGSHLVYVSSYVYGTPTSLPISEGADRRPTNSYMHSKVLAEDCCSFYATEFGVGVLVVRPFNVYGPGQGSRFIIPTLIGQLLDPAAPHVEIADPRPRRDFLFVDDLVELLVQAATARAAGVVNAGTGHSFSIEAIHDILQDLTGIQKPLRSSGVRRRGEVMDVVADIRSAGQLLGWQPSTQLRDGLRMTLQEMART